MSGLIWPGDYVDVVLTQVIDKADLAHRTLSETVYKTISETDRARRPADSANRFFTMFRIVAIDQEIVQGGPANNATAGKVAHTVSLQLAPEQVKKITVAEQLGKLSLAVRSAVDQQDTADTGTMFSGDVSPEIARQSDDRQSATVVVNAGDKVKEYSVKLPEKQ